MTRPSPDAPKSEWRRWAKTARSRLEPTLSGAVIHALSAWPDYRTARHVLLYLAFGDELDLEGLYTSPDAQTKSFYTTRTWPGQDALSLHPLAAGLETHPYGYRQPVADAPRVEAERLDLALVPGLCFSRAGARIGYGKGYYDRLLPHLRPDVPRVGVTAEVLVMPRLPRAAWDVAMTHLATEQGVQPVDPSHPSVMDGL